MGYSQLIGPFIGLIISVYCYFKFIKDNKFKIIYSNYPPKGFDSLKTSFYFKGSINDTDIVSMLLYLATKGYITFEGSGDNVTLIKEKEYDGNKKLFKFFMNKLFLEKKTVRLNDLIDNNFYEVMESIKKTINNKKNKEKIFQYEVKKYRLILSIIAIISIYMLNYKELYIVYNIGFWVNFLIILMIFVLLYIMRKDTELSDKIVLSLLLLGSNIYMNKNLLINFTNDSIIYITGTILIIINTIFYINLQDRTRNSNEYLGEISGFKSRLERTRLRELKDIDYTKYFYDMIPYTYSFSMLDRWMNRAKGIVLKAPTWYKVSEEFEVLEFKKMLESTVLTITRAMLKEKK